MVRSLLLVGALTASMILPQSVRSADAPLAAPTVVLKMQSIETMLGNAEYIAALVGQDEAAKQTIGFIKSLAGDKNSIEGIDTQKPFAIAGTLQEDVAQSQVVILIPIKDEKAFLGLLKTRLSIEVKDEGKGLYSFNPPNMPVPAYFRFENGYAYATVLNSGTIDPKGLPKPEVIMGKVTSLIELSARFDRVPEQLKKVALGEIETKVEEAKKNLPKAGDPAEKIGQKFGEQLGASMVEGMKLAMLEGKEFSLKIDISPKDDEISLQIGMTAVDGSSLAKQFTALKSKKSVVMGGFGVPAMVFGLNMAMPESTQGALVKAVDELVKQFDVEVKDEKEKKAGKMVLEAVAPTLKSGAVDLGVAMVGPNDGGKYTVVGGAKIVNGKAIETAIKEAVKIAPLKDDKAEFVIDGDKIDGLTLHLLKPKDTDEKTKKIFGDGPAYVGFTADRVLFAYGSDAKKALKTLLAATSVEAGIMKFEMSAVKLAPLGEEFNPADAKKAVAAVFGKNPTGDTILAAIETKEGVNFKVAVKGKVIKFFGVMSGKVEVNADN